MDFSKLINISELQQLCKSFTTLTGAVTAILDMNGNILVATGWQDVCVKFHRVHPKAAMRCRESDMELSAKLKGNDRYGMNRCKNGLVDVLVPIHINGTHVANFITGQFLLEEINMPFFIQQATEYGFDKMAYLFALTKVPVISEQQLERLVDFILLLSHMIGDIGLERMSLEQANNKLIEEVEKHKLAEEKFSRIVSACPYAIYIVRNNGTIIEANKAFCDMSGFAKEEVVGKMSSDLGIWIDLKDSQCLADALREHGEILNQEKQFRHKDGTILYCLLSARTILINDEYCYLIFINDITEKRRNEQEIIAYKEAHAKAEKVSTMGTMAAAICHEINQPLNCIKIISSGSDHSFQQGRQKSEEEYILGMREISNQVDRINKIITHLRSFIRRDNSLCEPCDINAAVNIALDVIGCQVAQHNIAIELSLQENTPKILAASTAIEEVMINLLVNSMQALDTIERSDKRITIGSNFDDKKVIIEISDNGPGVDPQLGQQIFEPFVSTKCEHDNNLGLGLAIVKTIVSSCNGTIKLVSKEAPGATFRLEFPYY